MFKKTSFLILILLFVGVSNVLAFDLVEETKTMGIGFETGIVLSGDIPLFCGITGSYNINERLFIKGLIAVPVLVENYSNIFISCNPGYVLLENFDSRLYTFGMISNISPNFANVGAGLGFEKGGFFGFFRTVTELGYTSDNSIIINVGTKYSF